MKWLWAKKKENIVVKSVAVVTFAVMVVCNALANIIPINGVNTGQVSDSYLNLFAPIGFTFSVWGVIYLLLAGFCVYQFNYVRSKKSMVTDKVLDQILPWFIASSVLNSVWIFAWHYDYIGLSTILISLILVCLARIGILLNQERFVGRDYAFVQLPFSIYLGWITVAVIANVTTWLVSIEWNQLGLSGEFWTLLILVVGALIAIIASQRLKNAAYLAVIIWAYIGILAKHVSVDGFNGEYQTIISSLVLIIGTFTYVLYKLLYTDSKGTTSR